MKVILSSNPYRDRGLKAALEAQRILERSGAQTALCLPFVPKKGDRVDVPRQLTLSSLKRELPSADLLICFGGDGTILHAARDATLHDVPILGVNMGSVGFMAELERSELPLLAPLAQGNFSIEERMMLEGCIFHRDISCYRLSALNDIVITRSGFSRIISFKIIVNGELLDVYAADGVIISTPTGSTGYNLSAGGPIVNPEANVILITPVCPHSLQAKSIVLGEWDTIEIHIQKVRKTQLEEALVTFDGQVAERLNPGDIIKIHKSRKVAKVVKVQENSFYHTLRVKVGGKA